MQDAFVTKGQVLFCCQEKKCPMARKVARVILNFARVKISLYQNAGLSIRMHYLGLEKAQIQIFKVILIINSHFFDLCNLIGCFYLETR